MKKIIILLVITFVSITGFSQQDAMFTHYAFNTMSVNPAYAGNRGMLTATFLQRNQWVKFDGGPITQSAVINTPIYQDILGLGISVINDKIGPVRSLTTNIDFSYSLRLGNKQKLTFGIKGLLTNYNRDLNSLISESSDDQTIIQATTRQLLPNVGTGLLYTNQKFYAGLSVPRLMRNMLDDYNESSREERHYFLTAGTLFQLGNNLDLRPSTFVKLTTGAPVEIDLTGILVYKEMVELGLMLRTTDAIGILLGYIFEEKLRIGYSFDWSYGNKTFISNYGSHELMLRYDFLFKENSKRNVVSPRYF